MRIGRAGLSVRFWLRVACLGERRVRSAYNQLVAMEAGR